VATSRTMEARIGALSRHRRPDDPDLTAARLALAERNRALYVAEVVDRAPGLSPEQRERIAAALVSLQAAA